MEKPTLDDILVQYNSIARSRRRWFQNRVKLRNEWPELYKVLEAASGRKPGKVLVFDPNWHEVAQKGATTGAVDRLHGTDTAEVTEIEEVAANEAVIMTEKPEADLSEDPLFQPQPQIAVKDESVETKVAVKKVAKKKKKK